MHYACVQVADLRGEPRLSKAAQGRLRALEAAIHRERNLAADIHAGLKVNDVLEWAIMSSILLIPFGTGENWW